MVDGVMEQKRGLIHIGNMTVQAFGRCRVSIHRERKLRGIASGHDFGKRAFSATASADDDVFFPALQAQGEVGENLGTGTLIGEGQPADGDGVPRAAGEIRRRVVLRFAGCATPFNLPQIWREPFTLEK